MFFDTENVEYKNLEIRLKESRADLMLRTDFKREENKYTALIMFDGFPDKAIRFDEDDIHLLFKRVCDAI